MEKETSTQAQQSEKKETRVKSPNLFILNKQVKELQKQMEELNPEDTQAREKILADIKLAVKNLSDSLYKLQKDFKKSEKTLQELGETLKKQDKSFMDQLKGQQSVISKLQNPPATSIEYTFDAEESFILPMPGKKGSIGDDLYTTKPIRVPHGRSVIPINLILNLPPFVEAKVEARSGFSARGIATYAHMAVKRLLGIPIYTVEVTGKYNADADILSGKIDPGYREPIGVIINNHGLPFTIPAETKIAQITYYHTLKHKYVIKESVEDFTDYVGNRGGGWGSSD